MGSMTCYHPTKTNGDIGVMKAKLDLMLQGYMILQPETEHAPFDLVAYQNNAFLRVQVKYKGMRKNGTMHIKFRRNWTNAKGCQTRPIDKNAIDLFCIYCPDTDLCYYIDPKKFDGSITLRVQPSKRGGTKYCHNAEDFLGP